MGMELYQELDALTRRLDESISDMRTAGSTLADAERTYRVALRKNALGLRTQGLQMGIINLTVRGIPEVADARFKRDVAQTIYDASKEVVMATKLKMRIVQAQIQQDYGNPSVGYGGM